MIQHQVRDLEVRVQIPVQVQLFLLKFMEFMNINISVSNAKTKQSGKNSIKSITKGYEVSMNYEQYK